VWIARGLQQTVGRSIVEHFQKVGYRVLTVAVTRVHAHALVELPDNIVKIRTIVGEAKRVSSRAVKDSLPGSVWSAGGTYKPIRDSAHQRNAYDYILYDQGPGAWTWCFQDGATGGQFRRPRPIAE
jgi:REP element-mobilizing transposase RayT